MTEVLNAIQVKEREDRAVKFNQIVMTSLFQRRKSTLILAGALKEIRDGEFWKELDYKNFNSYLASAEICLKPASAELYISVFEFWMEKQQKKLEDLQDISIHKLQLLKDVKRPERYFDEAKSLPFNDFKKLILEKEEGIKSDDKEVENYIKRNQASCPHWDYDRKKCKLGKDSDLI